MIGSGGLGRVYRARDLRLERDVAVKFVRRRGTDTAEQGRLVGEAKALARLADPNVVGVFDVGLAAEDLYIAMELVEGRSLDQWLHDEKPGWAEIVSMFVQAGRGLRAAHDAHVVHRDFKPANVMIGDDKRVRVVDFGLARLFDSDTSPSTPSWDEEQRTSAAGTRPYMAPEQFDGKPTALSDQYGFCVSLFEALCDVRPFTGSDCGISDAPVRRTLDTKLKRTGAPRWLRRVVLRGLAKEQSERYGSMSALLADLQPRSKVVWGAVGLAALTLGGAAVIGMPREPEVDCNIGAAMMAGIWNDGRRESLRDGFAAVSQSASWADATPVLETFASGWVARYRESCEAHERGEDSDLLFDLRTRCLRRSLDRVDLFLHELDGANADGKAQAGLASSAAAIWRQCDDGEGLLLGRPVEGGYDDVLDDRIRREIDKAAIHRSLGEHDKQLAVLLAARDALEQPNNALDAELWLTFWIGNALNRRAESGRAEAVVAPALLRADRDSRGRLVGAVLRIELANAVAAQPGRAKEAVQLSRQATVMLEGPGRDTPFGAHTAEAYYALAHANYFAMDYEAALVAANHALAATRNYDDPLGGRWRDTRSEAGALHLIGEILVALNRLPEAVASYNEGLAVLDGVGEEDQVMARLLDSLGVVRRREGKTAEAVVLLARATEIWRSEGLDGALSRTTSNLGNALYSAGRHDESIAAYTEAIALIDARRDPEPSASAQFNRGLAQYAAGRYARADSSFSTALGLWQERHGIDSPRTCGALVGRGQSLLALGRHEKAGAHFEHALEIEPMNASPYSKAEVRIGLAKALATSKPARARRLATEALSFAREGKHGALIAEAEAWLQGHAN